MDVREKQSSEKRLIDANRAMEIVRNQGIAHPSAYHLTNYATLILREAPTVDAVPVVRCRECKWYDPAHIRLNDGTRGEYRDYQPNDILEVGFVTVDIGINVAGRCVRETYIDNLYRKPDDFCSRGENKEGAENG